VQITLDVICTFVSTYSASLPPALHEVHHAAVFSSVRERFWRSSPCRSDTLHQWEWYLAWKSQMGPKKEKKLQTFYQNLCRTSASFVRFLQKKFRDCGDLPMGHVLKFREIRSRGSRATGVLIWGGPFTPKHSVPPSSLRSPNVLHVQECARGTLSPCQVQWGLACHRGNQKCWVFCLSVCHVVSWKCGKIWGFCLSAAAWNSSLLKITPQVSSYMLTCVKCLLITVMYLFSWKCRPEVHMM